MTHPQLVNAWLERVEGGSTQLIPAFEVAFAALWQRTHLTLGEVTLLAVVDRVLHTAKAQHPLLTPIETTTSGLHWQSLATPAGVPDRNVSEAIGFVLTEFLTVMGNLTAEILTPALHAALSNAHPRPT